MSGTASEGITVSGRGTVASAPDTVTLSLGVSVKRPAAAAAISDAAAAATKVLEALKAAGVAEADLVTTDYSISQEYRYPQNGSPRPDGFRVSNTVAVKIRTIGSVGAVLDAATAAGGDDIAVQGLAFRLDDDAEVQSGARELAFADARAKAEQFAELSGRPLGPVRSITQTELAGPPVTVAPMVRVIHAGSTPIQPGEVETAVTVEVHWSFSD